MWLFSLLCLLYPMYLSWDTRSSCQLTGVYFSSIPPFLAGVWGLGLKEIGMPIALAHFLSVLHHDLGEDPSKKLSCFASFFWIVSYGSMCGEGPLIWILYSLKALA